jgi:predicted polyphosphate/ATP-dependent NAD kinase
MPRLGLIVNPVAGLGGRVGLKGSDGAEIQRRARALGAEAHAGERAAEALARLRKVPDLEIITYPSEMGEVTARAAGFEPLVIGEIEPGATTADDTRRAVRQMQAMGIDLLLFAGGDGTARDICEAAAPEQPVLGIPAGVKIHSAVYATNPVAAGDLAALYLTGRAESLHEAEVMDIDEEAFRHGSLSARLYGYLHVPYRSNLMQSQKVPTSGEAVAQAAIGGDVASKMEPGVLYIIGPGTTTRGIAQALGVPKTLLGVDVVVKEEGGSAEQGSGEQAIRVVAKDANEARLLELLEGQRAKIVVTPIGGQGYIFGRGNQQISPRVIRQVGRENIMVVSTPDKLYALGGQPLLVDTGDRAVDEMLSGYLTVVTGYNERAVRRIATGETSLQEQAS